MRLVFATSLIPVGEPTTGYELANRAILDGLRSLGHEVLVLGFVEADKADQLGAADDVICLGPISVATADAGLPQKLSWLARAVRNRTTFAGAKLQIVDPRRLESAIRSAGADGVIVNGVTLASAFERVLTAQPFIYIAHNVEYRSARQNAAATGGFEQRLFEREARLLEAIERRLCACARHVHVLSEADRAPLGLDAPGAATVLPLTTRPFGQAPSPRTITCDATLIGTWTWVPNRIGLDWFLGKVTPHLPDDFTFEIAGRAPSDLVIGHPGGKLVGRVPDATDFVRQGAVVPLASTAGTGIQLKSLETFELGLPAVATPLSVRGIDNLPANVTVTDDPRSFADALVEKARAVRSGTMADLDGRAFHARQKAALETALDEGLSALTNRSRQAA